MTLFNINDLIYGGLNKNELIYGGFIINGS